MIPAQWQTLTRNLLIALTRHKYKALSIFLIALAVSATVAFLESPTYDAHATLLINLGRDYRYVPELSRDYESVTSAFRTEELLNTEMEILNGQIIQEKVIEGIGVGQLFPHLAEQEARGLYVMDLALREFGKALAIKSVKNSGIIHIYFSHKDAPMARRVVNDLTREFIEKHVTLYGDSRVSFFESKVGEYTKALNDSANALRELKQKYGIVNIEEQVRLLLQRQASVEDSLRLARSRASELKNKVVYLKRLKEKLPQNEVLPESFVGGGEFAHQRLLELRLKEQDLLKRYNEQSRVVSEVRKDIERVEEYMKQNDRERSGRFRHLPNKTYLDLELEIARLEPEMIAADRTIQDSEATLRDTSQQLFFFNETKGRLLDLEAQVAVKETLYRDYLNKLEEAKISEELDLKKVTNIRVIQEAATSPKPLTASRTLKILVGMMLGLLFGIGSALVAESRRRVFHTPESVEEKLGVPVLTTLRAR